MISGDHSLAANASSITSDNIIALQMELQNPRPFAEIYDQPEDAIGYIATTNVRKPVTSSPSYQCILTSFRKSAGVTYQVSSDVPDAMANLTALPNTLDSNYSSHALNK